MIGGAAIAFFGARFIPQNVAMLSQYNTGFAGYVLNLGVGLGLSWVLGRFWNRQAGIGGLVGTGLAVVSRFITEQFGTATPSGASAMSGDLDFDLGYYVSDRFPFPQGAGGPYMAFPGTPYLPGGAPITSAAAVRAGAAAAAAAPALPATAGAVAAAGPAATAAMGPATGGGGAGRWSASRWD